MWPILLASKTEHLFERPEDLPGTLKQNSLAVGRRVRLEKGAGAFEANASPCTDGDRDGFAAEGGVCGAADCNDANPNVNPGAIEIPGNGVDDDCNAATPGGCQQQLAEAGNGVAPERAQAPLDFALYFAAAAGLIVSLRARRRSSWQ